MTTSEMINKFRMAYDIVNLEGPGYEDEEVLMFLNQAQSIELLKEVAIRRWSYISNLLTNDVYGTITDGLLNYHRRVIPPAEKYVAYVSSKSKVTRTVFKPTSGAEWVENIPIQKERSGKYLTNANNKVILLVPRVYEEEDRTISIMHDVNTTFSGVNDFYLEYIREPNEITLVDDCEINTILHERIVNTAVDLGKKVFNPQEAGISQQTDKLMDNPEIT